MTDDVSIIGAARSVLWPVVLGLLLAGSAWSEAGAEDLESDEQEGAIEEVFLGELLFPQEEGELQVTLSTGYSSDETEAALTLEWGLSDRLQWEVEVEGVLDGDETGILAAEIGLRQTWLGVRPGLHGAIGLSATFEAQGAGGSIGDIVALEPVAVVARDFDQGHLFAQLSAEWIIDDGDEGIPLSGSETSDVEDELGDEVSAEVPRRRI